MLFKLTEKINIHLSSPIRVETKILHQLELKFIASKKINTPEIPKGFFLRTYSSKDQNSLIELLNGVGFSFDLNYLQAILSICLPKGCFIIEDIKTKKIVSMMMSRHFSNKDHPFGGRIDWLVTDKNYRGIGLGLISAFHATKRLEEAGYENIWVTTDDHRIGALKIFYHLGYRPFLIKNTIQRWENIYKVLGLEQKELEEYS